MKTISGIQMIGTQRSGSNLLRVIMDQSPAIASPHPPHILVTFMPLLPLYGPINNNENYKGLVSDIVDYINANPVPWEGVKLDKDELFRESNTHSLIEINRLVYEQAAAQKDARYWCCKSMNNMYFASEMEEHGLIDKYIYLYRDGRDVAASFKKAIVGEKHIYFLAKQWKQDQEECFKLKSRVAADRIFELSYEQLTSEPEGSVQGLCAFLGVPYTSEMLEYYTSSTSMATAASGEMWRNVAKPIMHNNSSKFLKSFTQEELEIFELIAGDTLKRLGYPLYTLQNRQELISEDAICGYQFENSLLKKQAIVDAEPGDLEKRKQQEQLLHTIKERDNCIIEVAN
jgi:hypothetical protein